MLSFADISQKILYDTSKAEGELLSLINSTISHEMRNPLNSIINQCKIMTSVAYNFLRLLKTLPQEIQEEMQELYDEFTKSITIQESSSSLLLLNVEDILGYA